MKKNIFDEFREFEFKAFKDLGNDYKEPPKMTLIQQRQADQERANKLKASENEIDWPFVTIFIIAIISILIFC